MLSGDLSPVQHIFIIMFSTLRNGSTIYILDRTSSPEMKIGYVESVSMPRPMYPTYNPQVSMGTNMQTVVDIAMRIGDEKKEFCVPANLSLHTYGDYTLSENKEAMISEVDSLLKTNKDVLDTIDKRKADISAYENILKDLNPVYAKEQERDHAIGDLSQRVDSIQDTLERLEQLLKNR